MAKKVYKNFTLTQLQRILNEGETLDNIADRLISVYNKEDETPIIKIINDLDIVTYVSNINKKPRDPNIPVPSNLKCFILHDDSISNEYDSEYIINVDRKLTLNEQRFWFAYCLGKVLKDNSTKSIDMISAFRKINRDTDECYIFAVKLLTPFI